ncbi:MAG: GAF domain-containing protein, partial [Candidatus Zixiibacteriota bacterium]
MPPLTDVQGTLNELEARLAATRAQLRDVATMGAVITSIHEINAVLSVFVEMAIRLVEGEVGLILRIRDGRLQPDINWGVSEEVLHNLSEWCGDDLPRKCYDNREPIVLNNLGIRAESGFTIDSILCLPIQTADACHGVVMVLNREDGEQFTDQDRESLEMLVNFAAVAIQNSNLIRDKLRQQKVAQEMAFARQVQESILPPNINGIDGVDIGAVYSPAREVGGDFYNIFNLGRSQFIVVIGDVSNKGVPAALVMSAASGMISSLLADDPHLSVS